MTSCRVLWLIAWCLVLPEGPFEFFLWRSRAGDVYRQQELFEVDEAVLVGVEGSEDVVTELLGVPGGEEHLVHVDELDGGQPSVGAVLLEPLVPLLDRVLVVTGMGSEKVQVFLGQALFTLDAAHCV